MHLTYLLYKQKFLFLAIRFLLILRIFKDKKVYQSGLDRALRIINTSVNPIFFGDDNRNIIILKSLRPFKQTLRLTFFTANYDLDKICRNGIFFYYCYFEIFKLF